MLVGVVRQLTLLLFTLCVTLVYLLSSWLKVRPRFSTCGLDFEIRA